MSVVDTVSASSDPLLETLSAIWTCWPTSAGEGETWIVAFSAAASETPFAYLSTTPPAGVWATA
jgi:hypothetical protein